MEGRFIREGYLWTDPSYATEKEIILVLDTILKWGMCKYPSFYDSLDKSIYDISFGFRRGRPVCYIITSPLLWNIILNRTPDGKASDADTPIPIITLDDYRTSKVMQDIENYRKSSVDNKLVNEATFEQASRLILVFSEVHVFGSKDTSIIWKNYSGISVASIERLFKTYNTGDSSYPKLSIKGKDIVVQFDPNTRDCSFAKYMTEGINFWGRILGRWN